MTSPRALLLMRHDIDRKPENALSTARIEAESGIRATYYFSTLLLTLKFWSE
ncbi:MAG: hypothetical protein Q7J35_12380 [Candidatus Methanoperedens sp.]|nr:hypothetical protein [Candidatus Methanoperedens sp.]